jgi:hypothetical protein
VVGTFSKLVDMIESGKKSEVPENLGAMVGTTIDQVSGNKNSQLELSLGITNDVMSLFISPESNIEWLNDADDILNSRRNSLLPYYGIYEDVNSMYNKW